MSNSVGNETAASDDFFKTALDDAVKETCCENRDSVESTIYNLMHNIEMPSLLKETIARQIIHMSGDCKPCFIRLKRAVRRLNNVNCLDIS